MPTLALSLFVVFLTVATLGRIQRHYSRTGDHGIRRPAAGDRATAYLGIALCSVGALAMLLTPILILAETVRVVLALDRPSVQVAGVVLAISGATLTLAAQLQMGDSWRIGVERGERTVLVTDRLFGLVRNPIYSGLGLFGLGFVLLVPNVIAASGFVVAVLGVVFQVRLVEEPNLAIVHGDRYRAYASRTGRFVPGLGKGGHVAVGNQRPHDKVGRRS